MISYFWLVMTFCDYRCPYCVYGMVPNDPRMRKPKAEPERWVEAWGRMHDKYGPGKIVVTGGEPTSFPGFDDMIIKISKWHWIEMDTSLQLSIERLRSILRRIPKDRLRFSTSFHPHMTDFDAFIQKVKAITSGGYSCLCRLVAYPSIVEQIPAIREEFAKMDTVLFVNPFNGDYHGKGYPAAYTSAEREIIYNGTFVSSPERAAEFHADIQFVDQMLNARTPKGRLCRSGFKHARVEDDGRVYRCQPYSAMKWDLIGNMFEDVELWDGPRICNSDQCEWESRWLVDEADRFRNQDPTPLGAEHRP